MTITRYRFDGQTRSEETAIHQAARVFRQTIRTKSEYDTFVDYA